jgi:glycosyltransferase involved in cell wall biosynthesis
MKRICTIRHKYYPSAVPTRRNAETLADNGYEVDVICLKNKGEKSREIINGVNVYRQPVAHRREGIGRYIFEYCSFFLLAFWQITWLSLRRKYQVIQIDNMPDFLVFTTILPKLMGSRVILEILDHTPEVFMDGFKVSGRHSVVRVLRWLENASMQWADHIIVTQSTSQDVLIQRGIPPGKISVVLNVPEENVFVPVPPAATNSHFHLITHGRLVERYGVQTIIKAIPLLIKEIPNIEVEILGDGEGLPHLKELADYLGVNDHVRFPGWVNISEVPAHIAQADLCLVVIPAGANPAMPNKLFEYSALNKPSVVTSISTIKAYYDDNTVMYYEADNEADMARCIIDLYHNPAKRKAMAAASLTVYEKYRWDTLKHEYIGIIDRLSNE